MQKIHASTPRERALRARTGVLTAYKVDVEDAAGLRASEPHIEVGRARDRLRGRVRTRPHTHTAVRTSARTSAGEGTASGRREQGCVALTIVLERRQPQGRSGPDKSHKTPCPRSSGSGSSPWVVERCGIVKR